MMLSAGCPVRQAEIIDDVRVALVATTNYVIVVQTQSTSDLLAQIETLLARIARLVIA